MQRKLAASMSMTHTLTMNSPELSVLRLQEKGGPIDTDTTYDIGGESVTIKAGPREFVDAVKWDDAAGTLVMTRLHVPDKDFEVVVTRYLEDNGSSIRLVYKEQKSYIVILLDFSSSRFSDEERDSCHFLLHQRRTIA